MKYIDLGEVKAQTQRRISFYNRTLGDIEIHERELTKEMAALQSARQQLLQLKLQLPDAPSRPCIFCGGTSRDLSMVIDNVDAFGHLGNTGLTLEYERQQRPVPSQWECQTCGAFDIDSPGEARIWSREELPGPKTLSRQMLVAFPSADRVAIAETSHGTIWMLQVGNTWYFLPGTGAQIVERLRSRNDRS